MIYQYKQHKNFPSFYLIFFAAVVFAGAGCKKFVAVEGPVTSTNAGNVYNNDASAASVLTGIYSKMSDQGAAINASSSFSGITFYTGLTADELTLFATVNLSYAPFYKNDLTPVIANGWLWNTYYQNIFVANSAIEGLSSSTGLSAAVKQQLLGEAKFIRAFSYFYLVNLFGDVPLALSSDYKVNAVLSRTAVSEVYSQVIKDLSEAKNLLNSNYVKSDASTVYPPGSAERVRPNRSAASALLARVYLYTGNNDAAEAEATAVISNTSLYSLSPVTTAFLKNSSETIWGLQPVRSGTQSNTGEGALFILPPAGPDNIAYPVYLNPGLVNIFEAGDLRKTNWIDSVKPAGQAYYYTKKYKIGKVNSTTQEYSIVLRLAEQYLVRAEARAQLGKIAGAKADLDAVRARAGISPSSANDKNTLLDAIIAERRLELFTEWGHRWFDLKRTGRIDAVMATAAQLKGSTWSTYKSLFPIPQSEINLNPGLNQNSGY